MRACTRTRLATSSERATEGERAGKRENAQKNGFAETKKLAEKGGAKKGVDPRALRARKRRGKHAKNEHGAERDGNRSNNVVRCKAKRRDSNTKIANLNRIQRRKRSLKKQIKRSRSRTARASARRENVGRARRRRRRGKRRRAVRAIVGMQKKKVFRRSVVPRHHDGRDLTKIASLPALRPRAPYPCPSLPCSPFSSQLPSLRMAALSN